MESVDIIIPSKGDPHAMVCLASLKYIPFTYNLFFITKGAGWPEAVNIGFRESKRDVLLMDDDVTILPETFNGFERFLPYADILGFRLLYSDLKVQHGGSYISKDGIRHRSELLGEDTSYPAYMCHVTTSLCYIKRKVIDKVQIDESFKGYQFEDVDFSFRAIDAGFKILYTPCPAMHYETVTKRKFGDYIEKMRLNEQELRRRYDFGKYVGIQPL